MTFTPITHQFTLFDYNQMRPRTRIPIKRISRQRMEEVMRMRKNGDTKPLLNMLRGLNDDLERYCTKHGI
jgi:hypothetical protein